jgi:hypothetical protein
MGFLSARMKPTDNSTDHRAINFRKLNASKPQSKQIIDDLFLLSYDDV